MKYFWDKDSILKRYKNIQTRLQEDNLTEEELEQLEYDIQIYQFLLLPTLDKFPFYLKDAIKYLFTEHKHLPLLSKERATKYLEKTNSPYYSLESEYLLLKKLRKLIYLEMDIPEDLKSPKMCQVIKLEETLSILENLFKELGPFVYERFGYYINPNNHLLELKKDIFANLFSDYYGFVIRDYTNDTSYGKIPLQNNLQDAFTIGHELFHLILLERQSFYQNKHVNLYLREIEGSLFEKYFIHYLNKKAIYQDDTLTLRKTEIKDQMDNHLILYVNQYLLRYLKQEVNIKDAIKRTNEKLDKKETDLIITPFNISSYLEDPIASVLTRTVSYLTALELFENYNQDPEQMIYILYKLKQEEGSTIDILRKYNLSFVDNNFKTFKKELQILF